MKMPGKIKISILSVLAGVAFSCQTVNDSEADSANEIQKYEPTWESLKQHQTPQWLRDGKFGIYTHWGVYAVHAMGPNSTWYSINVYRKEDGWQRKDFEERFGKLKLRLK